MVPRINGSLLDSLNPHDNPCGLGIRVFQGGTFQSQVVAHEISGDSMLAAVNHAPPLARDLRMACGGLLASGADSDCARQ